ncbi:MAG: hypothetical protein ACFFCQ_05980 [Promethearchaeota archaeon]
MSRSRKDTIWTLKIDRKIDEAVQQVLTQLGYTSKAELAREAIREFLIRRKLFSLLGGEPVVPISPRYTPEDALNLLITHLKGIPADVLKQEIQDARSEIAKDLLENTENY